MVSKRKSKGVLTKKHRENIGKAVKKTWSNPDFRNKMLFRGSREERIKESFSFDLEGGKIFWKKTSKFHPQKLGKEAGSSHAFDKNKITSLRRETY